MSGEVDIIDLVSDSEYDNLFSQDEVESLKALEAIETIERDFYARKEKTSKREQRSERRRAKKMLRQKIDEQRRILSTIEKTKKKKRIERTPVTKSSAQKTKSPTTLHSPVQTCCVCLTEPVNVTLRPCGHHLCRTCAGKVSDCPLCRVKISKLSPGLMELDTTQVAKRKQSNRSKIRLSLTNKGKKRKKQQGKMGNIRNFFRPG